MPRSRCRRLTIAQFTLPTLALAAVALAAFAPPSKAQSVPAPASSYWPLDVGNVWEYTYFYNPGYSSGEYMISTRYHVLNEVDGQPGHFTVERRRQRSQPNWPPFDPTFDTSVWSFDEATGYRMVDGAQVGLWLGALDGDTAPCGNANCQVTEAIGTVEMPGGVALTTGLKTFDYTVFPPTGGFFSTSSEFASGVGPVSFSERRHNGVDSILESEGLRYAYVGGVEYGTPGFPVAGAAPPAAGALDVTVGPNPSAGAVTVRLSLSAPGDVRVEVVDVLGRRVAGLADGARRTGLHTWTWDAAGAAPGAYVVRVTGGGATATRRVTVVR